MDNFIQTLRNLGPARLGMIGATMVGMIVFFFFLTSKMSTGNMTLLYADLPSSDAGAITTKLDALQVPYEVSADGNQIKVPADQVGKLRMTLAAQGLPNGGSTGYELFDQQNSFGTSAFVQNINQVRALEGELSRSIGTLGPIRAARVHLVLPKRELFAKESEPASASVLITMRGASQLSKEQIAAIQHLVASSVPQLKAKTVSIIDNQGNLLARGDDSDEGSMSADMDETRRNIEKKLSREIEELVGRTVGAGKVRATVNADLDYDRIATSQEKYDPEGQVARSTQTVTENAKSSEGGSNQGVTVANNLPAGGDKAAAGSSASNNNDRTEETTNYEVSRSVINTTREVGRIKKLSVALLVDGVTTKNDKGEVQYAPRADDEMQKIEALAKSAMGFDADRGDTIEVANMRFASDDTSKDLPPEFRLMGLGKDELVSLLSPIILGLIGILFLLLIVRPLVMRLLQDAPAGGNGGGMGGLRPAMAGGGGDPMLSDQSGGAMGALMPPNNMDAIERTGISGEIDRMINMEQVEGRVRASSLKKISEMVDKHPEHAVSIIRNWMYQDSN